MRWKSSIVVEALLKRDGQQEAEEHLHARHDDAQLVEQLDQLAVEPLASSSSERASRCESSGAM